MENGRVGRREGRGRDKSRTIRRQNVDELLQCWIYSQYVFLSWFCHICPFLNFSCVYVAHNSSISSCKVLFPNALILHVAREPMDTIFSAYKHEFPPGPLDYTSDFPSLAEMYHGYRDLMEHWVSLALLPCCRPYHFQSSSY
jgi:hypothetical protein